MNYRNFTAWELSARLRTEVPPSAELLAAVADMLDALRDEIDGLQAKIEELHIANAERG